MTEATLNTERTANELNQLGFWLFLASEVLLFGSLFLIYIVYRNAYPAAFTEASSHLNATLAGLNTGLLLTSSFLVACAVHWIKHNQRRAVVVLGIVVLLGLAFMGIKAFEYYIEYQEQLIPMPGLTFEWEGAHPQQAQLFFTLYFIMTGLHAIHLIIGVLYIAVMTWLLARQETLSDLAHQAELMGLYWHFVDVVWVFVYPLLYLIDRAG